MNDQDKNQVVYMETSHSESLNEIFSALSKAQGRIENALKDKKNPFFKSSYADLSSVWDVCREPLSSNGLSIIQTVEGTKTDSFLITWLGHASGQWIRSKMPLLMQKSDPQSMGSAITYARRYALSAMVGVCADADDDGEKAMNRKQREDSEKVEPMEDAEKLAYKYASNFPDEKPEYILEYLTKYKNHYKQSMLKSLQDYVDTDRFLVDFHKWKKQHEKAVNS